MNTKPRVLVLGGFGFIGRYTVQALVAAGFSVVIGSRHQTAPADCKLACRCIRFEQHTSAESWKPALCDIDVVINCVGILRERSNETYECLHQQAPLALAQACAELSCRLIHISALGLTGPVRSRFLRSKRAGEIGLMHSRADWLIVRPSLLYADHGGFGARWLRRVARWPVHVLPASARGKIAALRVEDLAEAIARLVSFPLPAECSAAQRQFELGGDHPMPMRDLLAALRREHNTAPAWRLTVPHWLARIASHVCDLLHFSPYSFGHLELLGQDNCPAPNRLSELLGRPPRCVGSAVPTGIISNAPAVPVITTG